MKLKWLQFPRDIDEHFCKALVTMALICDAQMLGRLVSMRPSLCARTCPTGTPQRPRVAPHLAKGVFSHSAVTQWCVCRAPCQTLETEKWARLGPWSQWPHPVGAQWGLPRWLTPVLWGGFRSRWPGGEQRVGWDLACGAQIEGGYQWERAALSLMLNRNLGTGTGADANVGLDLHSLWSVASRLRMLAFVCLFICSSKSKT